MKLNNFFGTIFMSVLLLTNFSQTTAFIDVLLSIFETSEEIMLAITDCWGVIDALLNEPSTDVIESEILAAMVDVSARIIKAEEEHAPESTMTIDELADFISNNFQLVIKRSEIYDTIKSISSRFEIMREYEANRKNLENHTLLTFAEWTVTPNQYSINHLMRRLHLTVFGSDDNTMGTLNMFALMAKSYKETKVEMRCLNKQSAQQSLYFFYTEIEIANLKAYAMVEFSWMLLKVYGKGNFTKEAELLRNNFAKRLEKSSRLLRNVMSAADRDVWRCDPEKYELGKTYEEVSRLLQGYIENEVDMHHRGSCWSDCSSFENAINQGCYDDEFCSRQEPCSGSIYNCRYYDSDVHVCLSPKNSKRRYEFVAYENGLTLGRTDTCYRGTTKAESWYRWIFWRCSYCFCLCDDKEHKKSDRYFNLRETLSNTTENKVVTGIRFRKVNRIFHLQIQEGQLLPRAMIKKATLNWKPVDNYNLNDKGVKMSRDYFRLNFENRSFSLDNIQAEEKGFVVTGVRFRYSNGYLNLEIKLNQFNIKTGKLQQKSYWKSNDISERQKIIIEEPDVPTRTYTKSVPNSSHNEYIEFTHSSLAKDAAQTTVPFIDIQQVSTNPAVPLAGIGLYYKGHAGFGGFMAPKLITYDFASHFENAKLPQN